MCLLVCPSLTPLLTLNLLFGIVNLVGPGEEEDDDKNDLVQEEVLGQLSIRVSPLLATGGIWKQTREEEEKR